MRFRPTRIKRFTTTPLGATISRVLFQGEVEFLTGGKSDAGRACPLGGKRGYTCVRLGTGPALTDEPATLPALVRLAG